MSNTQYKTIYYNFGFGSAIRTIITIFSLYKIKVGEVNTESWERVQVRGGKELDVRVVAHTAVYHAHSNSILIYGGVVASVARFVYTRTRQIICVRLKFCFQRVPMHVINKIVSIFSSDIFLIKQYINFIQRSSE